MISNLDILQSKIVELMLRGVQVDITLVNCIGEHDILDFKCVGIFGPKELLFKYTYKVYTEEGVQITGGMYSSIEEAMSNGIHDAELLISKEFSSQKCVIKDLFGF